MDLQCDEQQNEGNLEDKNKRKSSEKQLFIKDLETGEFFAPIPQPQHSSAPTIHLTDHIQFSFFFIILSYVVLPL